MTEILFWNILRWLVVANSIVLLLQSIRVISTYQAVYVLTPKDWKRQLPLHVWLMALSFFIYVATSTYYLALSRHTSEGPRILCYGAAGLIAQYALWGILSYDRRRYSKATNFQDPHPEDGPG